MVTEHTPSAVSGRIRAGGASSGFMSSQARRSLSAITLVALLGLLTGPFVPVAEAARVSGIRPATGRAVAPRGGVMMIPLTARKPGDHWPATMTATLADGRTIDGAVAWIAPDPAGPSRRWTSQPAPLLVRGVRPEDDTSRTGTGTPYLLVRAPRDGDGDVEIGSGRVTATWRDVPDRIDPTGPGPGAPLPIGGGSAEPDASAPFEAWRWRLLADARNASPPDLGRFSELEAAVAEHVSDLWMIALGRLAEASRGVAIEARDLLVRVATDEGRPLAAWIADPQEVAALLTSLVNFRTRPDRLVAEAVDWLDRQKRLLIWVEANSGDRVRLAVINRTSSPIFGELAWRAPGDIPIGREFPPGELVRISVVRPARPEPEAVGLPAPPEPAEQILRLSYEEQSQDIAFGPRTIVARPPAVFVNVVRPALTLAYVDGGLRPTPTRDRVTFAQVRRLSGRWEVFFECLRPPAAAGGPGSIDAATAPDDVRGVESVTLFIGPEANGGPVHIGPIVALTVPERGGWRLFAGSSDGGLEVHRRSYADRWYARIVLPTRWLETLPGTTTPFGFMRTHGDGSAIETAPAATVPWRFEPSRSMIDLSAWDDLPG